MLLDAMSIKYEDRIGSVIVQPEPFGKTFMLIKTYSGTVTKHMVDDLIVILKFIAGVV